jgi:hypothetical protein
MLSVFPKGAAMKTFFAGLALGLSIGMLVVPRTSQEAYRHFRQRTQELEKSAPATDERSIRSTQTPAPERSDVRHRAILRRISIVREPSNSSVPLHRSQVVKHIPLLRLGLRLTAPDAEAHMNPKCLHRT